MSRYVDIWSISGCGMGSVLPCQAFQNSRILFLWSRSEFPAFLDPFSMSRDIAITCVCDYWNACVWWKLYTHTHTQFCRNSHTHTHVLWCLYGGARNRREETRVESGAGSGLPVESWAAVRIRRGVSGEYFKTLSNCSCILHVWAKVWTLCQPKRRVGRGEREMEKPLREIEGAVCSREHWVKQRMNKREGEGENATAEREQVLEMSSAICLNHSMMQVQN